MPAARPTILCLINAAAYSRNYFEELAPHLRSKGFNVVFALDSHLTDTLYGSGDALERAWYFTDFCSEQAPLSDAENARAGQRWSSLLSDFDRFLTIDIPVPLNPGDTLRYADVPVLLERFFSAIFDAVQPVAVVYEQASNSFALAANDVARARSVPFFSLAPGRISGRIEVSPTAALRDHIAVGKIWARVKQGSFDPQSRAIAEDYIRTVEKQVPDYMKSGGDGEVLARTSLWSKYGRISKLKHVLRGLRYRRRHTEDMRLSYLFGDPLKISWSLFRRSVKRRLRLGKVLPLYRSSVSEGAYFLYPLHFHPESSTSVLAPDFIDEMTAIKAIAFRLPTNVRLVVKEHPSAIALQSTEFYRQLTALPNVELIAASANAKLLAKAAVGVICVTSTLGFEAAALNKPVICLGDVLYGYFPNVRLVDHYGDLRSALDWALAYQPVDPEEIVTAMTAYVEFTDQGTFSFSGSLGDLDAIDNVATVLANRLNGAKDVMNTNHPAATL